MNLHRPAATALTTMALGLSALAAAAHQASPIRATVFTHAAAGQPGSVVRLGVTCTCEADRASARVFGRDVPLWRDGTQWNGLIGIDLTVKAGTYPISVVLEDAARTLTSTLDLVVIERQFQVRRLTVAPSFVDPPAAEVARITREAAALQALFAGAGQPRQWQGAFQPPVGVPANSSFGARSVFNGQERSPHGGTDFSARAGTPVSAPGAGVVALAESLYFTGNTVVLDHGLGLYSVLAHLSAFNVKKGDVVSRGHIVGTVGATGRATGAHLHWGVQLNGTRVDPLSLLAVTKDYEGRPQP